MPESHRRKHRRRHKHRRPEDNEAKFKYATQAPTLQLYLLPVFVVGVILAGGGMPLWATAVILIVGGLWGLRNPPTSSPERNFDWAVIGFLGSAFLALVPSFLWGQPDWWGAAKAQGVDLPWTTTAQPVATLYGIFTLFGGCLWFYLIWNAQIEGDTYRRLLWFLSYAISLLALAVAVGTYYGITYPLGTGASIFSFFDNRNQTANVLVMGGLISFALAMQGMRKGSMSGIAGLINMLVIFTGLTMAESRAGLLLFCLGCALWFIFRLRVSRVNVFFKFGVPVFIILLTLLFTFGQRTMERFSLWSQNDPGEVFDLRVAIYQDTVQMAAKHPLAGVGLGNFAGVFPQFRDKSQVHQAILHAESDWLWVLSEMGIFGVFFLLAGVLFLLFRFFPFGEDRTAPFRAAAAVAVFVFLVHTLFDVSGHRWGTLLLAFLLYRLAAPARSRQKLPVFGKTWWRVVAGISLTGGVVMLVTSVFKLPLHASVTRELAFEAVQLEAQNQIEPDALIAKLDQSLALEPLWWWPYSVRANARLQMRESEAARQDFRRASYLERTSSEVAFFEGKCWLNYDINRAHAAWRDALNRKDPNPQDLYRKMMEAALNTPRFAREFSVLTRFDPDFRVYYLLTLRGDAFDEEFRQDIQLSPKLSAFSKEQKAELLEHWASVGNGSALLEHLEQYPGIVDNEWYFRAMGLANENMYEEAVDLMSIRVKPMKIPFSNPLFVGVSQAEHQRLYRSTPEDILRGSYLLRLQINAGQLNEAITTAELLSEQERVPPYVYYWKGELYRKLGQFKNAWEAWNTYYRITAEMDDTVFTSDASLPESS